MILGIYISLLFFCFGATAAKKLLLQYTTKQSTKKSWNNTQMAKDLRPAPIVASWIQVPSTHAAPWIFPFFKQLHRTDEERLRASVAWFVDCYTSSLPLAQPALFRDADAHNFKFQLVASISALLGHYTTVRNLKDKQRINGLTRTLDIETASKNIFENDDNGHKKKYFAPHQEILVQVLRFLFRGGDTVSLAVFIGLLYVLNRTAARKAVDTATTGKDQGPNNEQGKYRLSAEEMMQVHFILGGSTRLALRVFNAFSKVTRRRVCHVPNAEFRTARHEVTTALVEELANPYSFSPGLTRPIGRQVKFQNVLNAEHLEDVDLIGTHRVILEPDGSPVTLWTLHFDQAQCTSTENITMVLGRSMNQEFSELQKPAAHTILMLDQADESPMLYKFVWDTNLVPGIKTGYQKGQPVRCLGDASCVYCNYREGDDTSKGEAFKASRKPFQHKGEEFMVHETKLRVVYVPDRKALYLILPIHSSWDNRFKLNLRAGKHTSWMDDDPSELEGMRWDLSTLQEANQLIQTSFDAWLLAEKRKGLYSGAPRENRQVFKDFFKKSQAFKDLCKKQEWGEGVDLMFEGFLLDDLTDLAHYMTDTLHLNINVSRYFHDSVISRYFPAALFQCFQNALVKGNTMHPITAKHNGKPFVVP